MKYSKEDIIKKVHEFYKEETEQGFPYPIIFGEDFNTIGHVYYNHRKGEVVHLGFDYDRLISYDKGMDGIICHELAHILEIERHGESDHGKRFFDIYYKLYPYLGI